MVDRALAALCVSFSLRYTDVTYIHKNSAEDDDDKEGYEHPHPFFGVVIRGNDQG